jgi:polysaccharide biosynthesis/export protein
VRVYIVLILFLASCASYKQNIMFKSTEGGLAEKLTAATLQAEGNYVIKKHDRLAMSVYSNRGERLVDPNPELSQSGVTRTPDATPEFQINTNGTAHLPLLGEFRLEGLTLKQAEEALQKEYASFFKEPYVQLTFINKRVVVLGAPGGQVIPLTNENTSLLEVLAISKGISNDSKAHNIRLIRGEKVYEIDLSTIAGYRESNVLVEPGDVVYVEPVRRPFSEGLRDYYGLVSMIVGLATLLTVVANVK